MDYRIVVVRTPSYDAGASHYQPYELWLMNPITGEHYIIDEADYILSQIGKSLKKQLLV